MPRVEELLDSIRQSTFITTLDLAKGYWQAEDQPKTAFITPKGLFKFTTMQFGLQSAQATFQWLMDKVLRGTEKFTGVYLDDILIHSQSWSDHLEHVREVLHRLSPSGLTLKLTKCILGTAKCEYLGHRIGKCGVSPLESKVIAVHEITRPHAKKDVHTFLGVLLKIHSWLCYHCSSPDGVNKEGQTRWSSLDTRSRFSLHYTLKKALTYATVMRNPDPTQTFVLQSDASNMCVGRSCVESRQWWPTYCLLQPCCQTEKETTLLVKKKCLAVVLGVWAFEVSYFKQTIKLLIWMQQFKEKNNRLTRWSLALQPFNFMVQ